MSSFSEEQKCKVSWESDGKDWKIVLDGDCDDMIQSINQLPTRKRQYLQRRIQFPE
jgi:hypothetical protein